MLNKKISKQLARKLRKHTGMSLIDCQTFLKITFHELANILINTEKLDFGDLGTIQVKERCSIVKNPQTGKYTRLKRGKGVKYIPSDIILKGIQDDSEKI